MTIEIIKFAFVAGELSPRLFGRTDLEQYDMALAKGENWFVDYRGGLSTRAGTQFCDWIWKDDLNTKYVPFIFSPDIANTYVVLFGDQYIRFIQDGGYVLEASKTINSITKANPGVMNVTGHGFAVGDWLKMDVPSGMVELNNEIVTVKAKTVNTVTLADIDGNNVDTRNYGTFVSGHVSRVYTISSPYLAADLPLLQAHQIRDTLRLTRRGYKVRNLVRHDHTDWELDLEDFGAQIATPTGLAGSAIEVGGSAGIYTVTAVDDKGDESLPCDFVMVRTHNLEVTDNRSQGITVTWNPVPGARYYNVYRSRVIQDYRAMSRSNQVGFLGRSTGTQFNDNNVVPDFTRTPPTHNDPFADGKITQIDVLTEGAGYDPFVKLVVTDPNPAAGGFVGYPLVQSRPGVSPGPITGILIVNGGHDYTNPSFSIVGTGSGATFKATIGKTGGNEPTTSCVFQQRQEYAGTTNDPLKFWGSRPGLFSNFDFSQITLADDSYDYELDAESVAPIYHMIPSRGGMLLMTQTGIWQLTGASGASAVTAISAVADPQVYKGVAPLVPARVDSDVVYLSAKGATVRILTYDDIRKIYGGLDLTILSNHLLGPDKSLRAWAYSDEPFRQLWACREDGVMLCLTIVKEQKVFAWTPMTTQGTFEDVVSIEENRLDSVYFAVRRKLRGKWRKVIERLVPRFFPDVESAFCVDCGLSLPATYPQATLTVAALEGDDVLATTDLGAFTSADVGKVLRVGTGKMNVIAFDNASQVHVQIIDPITRIIPNTDEMLPANPGDWTLDQPVTQITGMTHLANQPVTVLADGNWIPGITVDANGKFTLPQAASRVSVGLSYVCTATTLPLSVQASLSIEGRRKRIVGLALRMIDSRGLEVGTDLSKLYPVKDRTTELWGEHTKLFAGMKYVGIEPIWEVDAQVYLVQNTPLPITILGYVVDADIGDQDSDH